MIRNRIIKILISSYLLIFVLCACRGIQIQNSKQASIEEFTKGQVMIFVKEEKNKYETAFGKEVTQAIRLIKIMYFQMSKSI